MVLGVEREERLWEDFREDLRNLRWELQWVVVAIRSRSLLVLIYSSGSVQNATFFTVYITTSFPGITFQTF